MFNDDLFILRERAQAEDLRNRVIPLEEDEPADYRAYLGGPKCQCGNVLTIADAGKTCRQCVLLGRLGLR